MDARRCTRLCYFRNPEKGVWIIFKIDYVSKRVSLVCSNDRTQTSLRLGLWTNVFVQFVLFSHRQSLRLNQELEEAFPESCNWWFPLEKKKSDYSLIMCDPVENIVSQWYDVAQQFCQIKSNSSWTYSRLTFIFKPQGENELLKWRLDLKRANNMTPPCNDQCD